MLSGTLEIWSVASHQEANELSSACMTPGVLKEILVTLTDMVNEEMIEEVKKSLSILINKTKDINQTQAYCCLPLWLFGPTVEKT